MVSVHLTGLRPSYRKPYSDFDLCNFRLELWGKGNTLEEVGKQTDEIDESWENLIPFLQTSEEMEAEFKDFLCNRRFQTTRWIQ